MTQIKDLSPKEVAPRLDEQCQYPAERSFVQKFYRDQLEDKMRRKGFDPAFCGRHVRYEIDGKRYCPLHAGQVALQILMEAKD